MILLGIMGCAEKSAGELEEDGAKEEAEVPKEQDDKIKLGITLYSLQNEYMVRFANAASDYAKSQEIELKVYDGNYDAELQISQVEEMIVNGVDGIILNPQDSGRCSECVERAVEQDLPIISVNTRVDDDRITSYVGSDDVEAGELIMQKAIDALDGEGNVVILEGPLGQSAQIDRIQGMKNVLKRYPDIHVIGDKTANWSRMEAKLVVSGWLQTFDRVDAVIAENDDMALGAIDAIKETGKMPGEDILVLGIDGLKEALDEVRSGNMLMTVYQDAEKQAEVAVDVLVKRIQGGQIEREYRVPLSEVTAENVEEY